MLLYSQASIYFRRKSTGDSYIELAFIGVCFCMIISTFLSNAMLEAAIDTGGELESVSIGLMKNTPANSTETVLADITAATL